MTLFTSETARRARLRRRALNARRTQERLIGSETLNLIYSVHATFARQMRSIYLMRYALENGRCKANTCTCVLHEAYRLGYKGIKEREDALKQWHAEESKRMNELRKQVMHERRSKRLCLESGSTTESPLK